MTKSRTGIYYPFSLPTLAFPLVVILYRPRSVAMHMQAQIHGFFNIRNIDCAQTIMNPGVVVG